MTNTLLAVIAFCGLISASANFLHVHSGAFLDPLSERRGHDLHHHLHHSQHVGGDGGGIGGNTAIHRAMIGFKQQGRRNQRRIMTTQAQAQTFTRRRSNETQTELFRNNNNKKDNDDDKNNNVEEEDEEDEPPERVGKQQQRPQQIGGGGGTTASDGGGDEVKLGTLSCDKYGGPGNDAAQELVYWNEIESDSHYVSPFRIKQKKEEEGQQPQKRYLTFEPDGGGWNNIRMAMETVVGLAIAMGRTLVLPPEQRMYLLGKSSGGQKWKFGFNDFFPMHDLANDNDGLEIITMEQYLQAEAMTGHLRDKNTGEVSFPPDNRTDWNGQDFKVLKEWLRNVTYTPIWGPDKCLAAFPASGEHKDVQMLEDMLTKILDDGPPPKQEYIENPVPVDATPIERMKENLANRQKLCVYDEEMQKQPAVHFMCYHKMRVRMLVHFYALYVLFALSYRFC